MPADNRLVTNHCKAGSTSAKLVFETRDRCQDFVVRYKEDGIPYAINSPFCFANTTITVRQSKSLEDRVIGKQFAPLWRCLQINSILFPDGDDGGALINFDAPDPCVPGVSSEVLQRVISQASTAKV